MEFNLSNAGLTITLIGIWAAILGTDADSELLKLISFWAMAIGTLTQLFI